MPNAQERSLLTESSIYAMDKRDLDVARELLSMTGDLLELLKPYRNLFNDDVRDALASCDTALEKASEQNW